MLEHARQAAPLECCGLLAGHGGVITRVYPAVNIHAESAARGRTEYEIAPRELFQIVKQMRAAGLEHMGIYHSHPATENVPSPRDLERAYYEDVAYFILSPRDNTPRPLRAFLIVKGAAVEMEVKEVDDADAVKEKEPARSA